MRVFWLARAYVHPRHPGPRFGDAVRVKNTRRLAWSNQNPRDLNPEASIRSPGRAWSSEARSSQTKAPDTKRLGSKVQGLGTAWTFY